VISQLRAAPNQLTLLRLLFVPFVVIALVEHHSRWALALFVIAGISDGLDGLLARVLKQQTYLGQYLDPIADKFLLSTLFLVLSFERQIPWYVTVLVFSRDLGILLVGGLLYATNTVRDLRPSIWGKANTAVQVATILAVLMFGVWPSDWLRMVSTAGFRLTFALALISWIHYTVVVGQRMRAGHAQHPSG
jgi:cardiolipin synthase (CMP-forming)